MSKIKLNLVSGTIVEKPLITAFKANNFEYVVLDNEMNGSMGLPIILVCKLLNGKLVKIVDQNEWQIVKEYLKNIIAGSNIEYIKVGNEIPADDIYYTQLTLPVPSFDTLKNSYKVIDNNNETATIMDINPSTPITPNGNVNEPVNVNPIPPVATPSVNENVASSVQPPVQPVNVPNSVNTVNPVVEPVTPQPQVSQVSPVDAFASQPTINPTPVAPAVENPSAPAVDINSFMPETPSPEINVGSPVVNTVETPVTPVNIEPSVNVNPSVTEGPQPVNNTPVGIVSGERFKEQKEAFMQACENMFDALVQKFEKELENNKN